MLCLAELQPPNWEPRFYRRSVASSVRVEDALSVNYFKNGPPLQRGPFLSSTVGLGQGYLDVDESVIGGLMMSVVDKGRGFVRVTGRARIRPRSFENWDRIQLCLRREGNGAWIIEGDEALRSLPRDDMRTSVSHILELAKELGSWPNAP